MFRKNAFSTILAISALLAMTFAILLISTPANAGPSKVEVCHIPPDDMENFHTINISSNAMGAHLGHGDLAGACSGICAELCDDGDACTISDTGDCEDSGCPVPVPVDCSDGLFCTTDSCSSASGCVNRPVVCTAPDLCHVAVCSEFDEGCVVTEKLCDNGCDLNTGECLPPPETEECPCFTIEDLQQQGGVLACGDNPPSFPDTAVVEFLNGMGACSGSNCAATGLSCALANFGSGEGVVFAPIEPEVDEACRDLIRDFCPSSSAAASSATASDDSRAGVLFMDKYKEN